MNQPRTIRPIEPNAIYTAEEAADLLALELTTFRRMLRQGRLKGSRKLGRWRIKGSELMKAA